MLAWRIVYRSLLGRVQQPLAIALLLASPLAVLGIYCVFPFPPTTATAPARSSSPSAFFSASQTIHPSCTPPPQAQHFVSPSSSSRTSGFRFSLSPPLPFFCSCPRRSFAGKTPSSSNPEKRTLSAVLVGAALTLLAALLLIHFTVGLGNYLHWTIQFAAQRRLPGLSDMLGVYRDPSLLWKLPSIAAGLYLLHTRFAKALWEQTAAVALLAAPFIYTLSSLLIYDDADERGDSLLALWPMLLILATVLALFNLIKQRRNLTLRTFLPIILLVAINGTLMSQQLWGSTYAIWPLLIMLAADMIAFLAAPDAATSFPRAAAPAMAVILSVTLLICGAFYTASEERLSYAQLPDEPVAHSSLPAARRNVHPGPLSLQLRRTPPLRAGQHPRLLTVSSCFPAKTLSTLSPAARRSFRCCFSTPQPTPIPQPS